MDDYASMLSNSDEAESTFEDMMSASQNLLPSFFSPAASSSAASSDPSSLGDKGRIVENTRTGNRSFWFFYRAYTKNKQLAQCTLCKYPCYISTE